MKLTPIDIANNTFDKKMFGYDIEQVTDFLQQVANALEAVTQERNSLRENLRERDLALADYRDRDKVLKDTITTASQMAEKFRIDADRESKLIIADAQQKSDIITRDSRDSLKKLYTEIADLKRQRMQFEANLKALASAHLSLLEQGEKYMPQMQLPNASVTESSSATTRSTGVSPLTAG